MSAEAVSPDPGLAPERTQLAHQRSLLAGICLLLLAQRMTAAPVEILVLVGLLAVVLLSRPAVTGLARVVGTRSPFVRVCASTVLLAVASVLLLVYRGH